MSEEDIFTPGNHLVEDGLDDLIQKARADPQQFAALYDRFLAPLYGYLYQHVANKQEAEELTSQTFLAAFEAFQSYRHRGMFAAWLFGIARKKLADHYRHWPREQSLEEVSEPAEDPHYLGQTVREERLAALKRVIATLPEGEKELLRLRFSAGLSFKEMALLLHKNEEAVKKSVYRLLARLQSQMEEQNV